MTDRRVGLINKWGRVTVENTEQAILRAFYLGSSQSTKTVDKFSIWLLAGTGATGALLVSQMHSVLPYLSVDGFKVCMGLLVISALCGFAAKHRALSCEIGLRAIKKIMKLLKPIIQEHSDTEDRILAQAKLRGMDVETEVDLEKILNKFINSLPWITAFAVKRAIKKQSKRENGELLGTLNHFISQSYWTYFQSGFFMLFMVTGGWYAGDI